MFLSEFVWICSECSSKIVGDFKRPVIQMRLRGDIRAATDLGKQYYDFIREKVVGRMWTRCTLRFWWLTKTYSWLIFAKRGQSTYEVSISHVSRDHGYYMNKTVISYKHLWRVIIWPSVEMAWQKIISHIITWNEGLEWFSISPFNVCHLKSYNIYYTNRNPRNLRFKW